MVSSFSVAAAAMVVGFGVAGFIFVSSLTVTTIGRKLYSQVTGLFRSDELSEVVGRSKRGEESR